MNSLQKNINKENNIHIIKDDISEDEEEKEIRVPEKFEKKTIQSIKFSEKEKEEMVKNYKIALLKEIGVILILIYNKNIIKTLQIENEKNKIENEELEKRLNKSKEQISYCSEILGTYYNKFIIESVIKNMMKHLKTYKSKILEINKVKDLITMTTYIKKKTRIPSLNKKINKNKGKLNRSNSTLNHSSNNLKIALTTLFAQLRDIKRSLNNSVNDINDMFKIPLKEFPEFKIKEIQEELFYEVFQNDPLIKDCIEKFRFQSDYHISIREIECGIESIFGKIIKKKFIFNEDKKSDLKANYKNKILNMENNLVEGNDVNLEKNEDNNINEDYIEDIEVNQFKENLKNYNLDSSQKKKLKCNVSKKWIKNLINGLKDCKTFK